MIKSKVETQSGKWNEFVPKCRQANKLKKAKTLFTATFLTELEFTGCRTVPCNKFTCAQYDVISVCSKFTVVDIISPYLRNLYVLYNWTALFSLSVRAAGVILTHSPLSNPAHSLSADSHRHSSTICYAHFQLHTTRPKSSLLPANWLEISTLLQLVCRYLLRELRVHWVGQIIV